MKLRLALLLAILAWAGVAQAQGQQFGPGVTVTANPGAMSTAVSANWSSTTPTGAGSAISLATDGYPTTTFVAVANNPLSGSYTANFEASSDGGLNWVPVDVVPVEASNAAVPAPSGLNLALGAANNAFTLNSAGWTNVRAYPTSVGSLGSFTVSLRASRVASQPITNGLITLASNFGTIGTVQQGNHASFNSSAWWTQITDTTNGPVTVKAASTAPVAADKAFVVALSPNDSHAKDSSLTTLDTDLKAAQPRKLQDGAGNALASSTTTPAGTEQALIVRNVPSGTQGVSGTFWPTVAASPSATRLSNGTSFIDPTQIRTLTTADNVTVTAAAAFPVTGTFWQATQPVSGTFWQATQPISGTVTSRLNDGAGTSIGSGGTGTGLTVTCTNCGGSTFADNAAFTAGTSTIVNVGGVFNDALAAVTSGSAAAPRITNNRALHINLRNASGTELATASAPLQVSLANTAANAIAIKVDGSAVTQPVSGTFWQATQPVSAATLPLPSGAATSAKQPALGTAGTASTDVLTVQGIAAMTPLKVDGSAVTQPVSGTFWQATQPVSGTVTANAGTGTFAVSGTFWQATQPVSGTVSLGSGAATIGALTANQSVNQTQINGVAVSTSQGVSDTGTQRMILSQEATYGASTTLKTATAAGTAPFFSICGSASKTVRIQRVMVSGTVATAAVYGDIELRKTSTATSGGTATTLTATPFDSNSAAATAVAKYYTVLPTAGTLAGTLMSETAFFPLTGTVAAMTPQLIYAWRDQDAESPTLRGVAQCLEMNFGTTTTNAPTLSVSVAWTEK